MNTTDNFPTAALTSSVENLDAFLHGIYQNQMNTDDGYLSHIFPELATLNTPQSGHASVDSGMPTNGVSRRPASASNGQLETMNEKIRVRDHPS